MTDQLCAMCGHEVALHDVDQNNEGTPYVYCGALVDPDGCPCDGYAPPEGGAVTTPTKAERLEAAEKAYRAATAPARKVYAASRKAREAELKAYVDATEAAEKAYEDATAPARKAYKAALRAIEEEP